MAAFLITYPVTSPTITLTLRPAFVRLVNPQATPLQVVHVAQGGQMFTFTPGTTPFVQRVLPLEIQSLHEADEGVYSGWADIRIFVLATLQGSKNPCRITDPDGDVYVVRYIRGLETMQEVLQGRFSGVLMFREDVP